MPIGRPLSATSWWRNSNNIAAHHAAILMEMWLAGVPIEAIKVLLQPLVNQAQFAGLIDICWSKQPTSRRYTVPKRVKRNLCALAKEYTEALHSAQENALTTDYFRSLNARIEANLKDRGVTEAHINAVSRRAEATHKGLETTQSGESD